jgi:serine/threonine protein kinase
MSLEVAVIFRDALLGLKFLHNNGWVHRDMKPPNIGVLPGSPPRAVLLDVGQATFLEPDSMLPSKPGYGGTVNYLAPEREMSVYDHAVDVWPMGVMGFELTYGHHPFMFAANPWRPGEKHEQMRPAFHQRYRQAIDMLSNDHWQYVDRKAADKNPDFIHCKC